MLENSLLEEQSRPESWEDTFSEEAITSYKALTTPLPMNDEQLPLVDEQEGNNNTNDVKGKGKDC